MRFKLAARRNWRCLLWHRKGKDGSGRIAYRSDEISAAVRIYGHHLLTRRIEQRAAALQIVVREASRYGRDIGKITLGGCKWIRDLG